MISCRTGKSKTAPSLIQLLSLQDCMQNFGENKHISLSVWSLRVACLYLLTLWWSQGGRTPDMMAGSQEKVEVLKPLKGYCNWHGIALFHYIGQIQSRFSPISREKRNRLHFLIWGVASTYREGWNWWWPQATTILTASICQLCSPSPRVPTFHSTLV